MTRSSTHAGGEEKEVVVPMDIDSADRRLQQAFKECHNARSGHMGAEATWKRVNEL